MGTLQRNADTLLPEANLKFIREALKNEVRVDGRGPYATRPVSVDIAPNDASATVAFGDTRVLATLRAALEDVRGHGTEGRLVIDVKLSPMASTGFDAGARMGSEATAIANLLHKVIADSSAADLEALIVLRGRRAWTLYLDVSVLDHDGNLLDAAVFAAMAALRAFRLPQTEVSDAGRVVVHDADAREPVALTIQHVPFAVTFALFDGGDVVAVDATRQEAAAAAGAVTVICNEFEELCGVQKVEGCGVRAAQLMRCVRLATATAAELAATLQAALDRHKLARVQHRVRRAGPAAGAALPAPAAAAGRRGAAVAMARDGGVVELAAPAAVTPQLRGLDVGGAAGASGGGADKMPQGAAGSAQRSERAGADGASSSGAAPPDASVSAQPDSAMAEESTAAAAADGDAGRGGLTSPAATSAPPAAKAASRKGKGVKRRSVERDAAGRQQQQQQQQPTDHQPGYDHFESIAALIAGPVAEGEAPSLEEAVRRKKKKKRQGKGGASGAPA